MGRGCSITPIFTAVRVKYELRSDGVHHTFPLPAVGSRDVQSDGIAEGIPHIGQMTTN